MGCRVSMPNRVWGTTFAAMRWAIVAARVAESVWWSEQADYVRHCS